MAEPFQNAKAFDDYLHEHGGETERPPPLHFRYISYDEFDSLPSPTFLIDGYIVKNAANLLFGASNSFKTALAVDTACCAATGRDWHDRPIKGGAGRVLYIATEGRNGVCRLRIRGWMEHRQIEDELRQNIEAFGSEIYINEPEDVDHLISDLMAKGGNYKLIVLDVAAGTISGSESDDEVAKAWVHGIQRLIENLGTTVLVLHHTGWADPNRSRGHSHIWASFDARFKVEGDKDKLVCTLSVDRIKDHDSSGFFGFRMEKVAFGIAGIETTVVPVLDDEVKPLNLKETWIGANQQAALDGLIEALDQDGVPSPGFTGMPTSGTVTTVETWERYTLPKMTQDDDRKKREALKRAVTGLVGKKLVKLHNEYVWNPR